jgi:hypothetical protein
VALVSALVWAARQPPNLAADVRFETDGHQVLQILCSGCRDGTSVSIEGIADREKPFVEGIASLPLETPLPLGDTPLAAFVRLPDGSQQGPIAVRVSLPFRIIPEPLGSDGSRPALRWLVQTTSGTTVQVDGKVVATDTQGNGAYEVELTAECTGLSSEKVVVGRTVHYIAFRGDLRLSEGDLTNTATIVPLELTVSVSAVQHEQVFLKGRTAVGSMLFVEGKPIPVNGGAFETTLWVANGSKTVTIASRMPGFLTRTAQLSLKDDAVRGGAETAPSRGPAARAGQPALGEQQRPQASQLGRQSPAGAKPTAAKQTRGEDPGRSAPTADPTPVTDGKGQAGSGPNPYDP